MSLLIVSPSKGKQQQHMPMQLQHTTAAADWCRTLLQLAFAQQGAINTGLAAPTGRAVKQSQAQTLQTPPDCNPASPAFNGIV
jgi:hypothetical protein